MAPIGMVRQRSWTLYAVLALLALAPGPVRAQITSATVTKMIWMIC